MTYPATNSKEASELLIDVSNQMHEIVNEDATTEVMTERGPVPSVRKSLADTFLFQDPIAWNQGSDETAFNQLRTFDGNIYWAPTATTLNPIPMGATPIADSNWKLAPVDVSREWILDEITTAQGDVLDGKLFKGSNGETVENGDVVEPGTTHLRALVGGKPIILVAWDILTLPATVTSIPFSDNGFSGYDIVTDQGTFEFVSLETYALRVSCSGWPTVKQLTNIAGWGADLSGISGSADNLLKAAEYGDVWIPGGSVYIEKDTILPAYSGIYGQRESSTLLFDNTALTYGIIKTNRSHIVGIRCRLKDPLSAFTGTMFTISGQYNLQEFPAQDGGNDANGQDNSRDIDAISYNGTGNFLVVTTGEVAGVTASTSSSIGIYGLNWKGINTAYFNRNLTLEIKHETDAQNNWIHSNTWSEWRTKENVVDISCIIVNGTGTTVKRAGTFTGNLFKEWATQAVSIMETFAIVQGAGVTFKDSYLWDWNLYPDPSKVIEITVSDDGIPWIDRTTLFTPRVKPPVVIESLPIDRANIFFDGFTSSIAPLGLVFKSESGEADNRQIETPIAPLRNGIGKFHAFYYEAPVNTGVTSRSPISFSLKMYYPGSFRDGLYCAEISLLFTHNETTGDLTLKSNVFTTLDTTVNCNLYIDNIRIDNGLIKGDIFVDRTSLNGTPDILSVKINGGPFVTDGAWLNSSNNGYIFPTLNPVTYTPTGSELALFDTLNNIAPGSVVSKTQVVNVV